MIPVLILPGALGTAQQFEPLLKHLPTDWPVFTMNFPGHGGLVSDQAFSMSIFSTAVFDFLEAQHIPALRIFGYSMGGYIALAMAEKYPERVKQVVTLGTKLDWSPEIAAGMNRMFDPEKIESKVPQFAAMLAQAHAPADWKMVCRRTSAFLTDLGNDQRLTEQHFARISCPVTIGWGSQDNVVTAEESHRVASQIPQGNFEILEGVKHPLEQIEMARLAEFLIATLGI